MTPVKLKIFFNNYSAQIQSCSPHDFNELRHEILEVHQSIINIDIDF